MRRFFFGRQFQTHLWERDLAARRVVAYHRLRQLCAEADQRSGSYPGETLATTVDRLGPRPGVVALEAECSRLLRWISLGCKPSIEEVPA